MSLLGSLKISLATLHGIERNVYVSVNSIQHM